jgi:hypothetical protein
MPLLSCPKYPLITTQRSAVHVAHCLSIHYCKLHYLIICITYKPWCTTDPKLSIITIITVHR